MNANPPPPDENSLPSAASPLIALLCGLLCGLLLLAWLHWLGSNATAGWRPWLEQLRTKFHEGTVYGCGLATGVGVGMALMRCSADWFELRAQSKKHQEKSGKSDASSGPSSPAKKRNDADDSASGLVTSKA